MDRDSAAVDQRGDALWGQAARRFWRLDPRWLSVNHGSFGAAPRPVLAAQAGWRRRMEARPGQFFRRELAPALRAAAGRLAGFLGAEAQDLGFVANATEGCNAVLRSFDLRAGDEVLVLDHGYAAVRNAVRHVAARAGARVTEAALPFPRPDPAAIVAAVAGALTPRTRLAVIDHITSPSALVLPLAEIVAACHAAGAAVLVDGAHGPGQVTLDLKSLGADWYVGNCHKFLCAPKGCGFLWAAPDRQAGLHPAVISHGYARGFAAEFDWTGTRDPSAFLAVPAALDFLAGLGGTALLARNTRLAAAAGALLAARLGTETGSTGPLGGPTGGPIGGAMATVRLPSPGLATSGLGTAEHAAAVQERLLDARADAPVHAIGGALWLRVSAHAYNEIGDYERLGEVLARILRAR